MEQLPPPRYEIESTDEKLSPLEQELIDYIDHSALQDPPTEFRDVIRHSILRTREGKHVEFSLRSDDSMENSEPFYKVSVFNGEGIDIEAISIYPENARLELMINRSLVGYDPRTLIFTEKPGRKLALSEFMERYKLFELYSSDANEQW